MHALELVYDLRIFFLKHHHIYFYTKYQFLRVVYLKKKKNENDKR